jgi:peptidoglycan DL-endopeptidase CwlO
VRARDVVKHRKAPADNGSMSVPRPRPRLAAALLAAMLVGLLAVPAPAAADPGAVERARAEAARVRGEVDRLQLRAEVMAEAYAATEERLQAALRGALAHQRALDDQELAVETAQVGLDEQVRGIYEVGPLVSAELLLLADDPHELALAVHVAGASLTTGVHAVDQATAAQAHDQALVAELRARQAEVLALRQRQGDQRAAIEQALAQQRALLGGAERHVRELVAAARAREEAARLALVAAAATRARTLGLEGFATAPPPTQAAATAVHAALGQLGKPYRWGASGPGEFDCSGLTSWAYRQAGVALPRTSRAQWSAGSHMAVAALLPGDLVFFGTDPHDPGTIHHVGMYVGQGLMVNAPYTGAVVRVEPVHPGDYVGATRVT